MGLHAMNWCLRECGKKRSRLWNTVEKEIHDTESKMYMDKRSRNLRRKVWLERSEEADFDY